MKMNELRLDQLLIWDDATGIGHGKPAVPQLYDAAYFKKYEHYDRTKLGCNLTDARLAFVRKHYFKGSLVDIGIGGGLFVLTANCRGYDINPHARAWLAAQERFVNPSLVAVDAMTFWDSMEHMDYPELLIQNARQWVFVSMPIYRSKEHCLGSKHFRPGEHVWYFTKHGLAVFMLQMGFELVAVADFETRLGREDILTFAFQRTEGKQK